jgi:dsDNA-binding SOS-regulon protein
MDNDFFEPDIQTVSAFTAIENLPISSDNKELLLSLLSEEAVIEQPADFLQGFQELINQIDELDPSAFKPLFLFDFGELYYKMGKGWYGLLTSYSYCFDEDKLSIERIKALPDLFTPKEDGKPSVFRPYVAGILYYIQDCADKDPAFLEAYKQKMQEVRSDSSFEERIAYYLQLILQNLPRHTEKSDEKTSVSKKSNSFPDFSEEDFFKATTYSVKLVAELEEMSENELCIKHLVPGTARQRFNISAFPFLVYGKEAYANIFKALHFLFPITMGYKYSVNGIPHLSIDHKRSVNDISRLDIPRWDKKNNLHEVFLSLAFGLSEDTKDMSMSILNRIFEKLNIKDILRIFSEYIKNEYSSTYGALLNEKNFELINPVRSELEYLDSRFTTAIIDHHKSDFYKCYLFLDYLESLSLSKPENIQALVPSIKDKTIKDVLDFIARQGVCGEFSERKKEAAALYDEFVDIIGEESAYLEKSVLSIEEFKKNVLSVEYEKERLAIFKQHCATLARKSPEDALSVTQFWFGEFHNRPEHLVSRLSSEAISNFAKNEKFFYKKVFRYIINNEDLVCRFLSIPQEMSQGQKLSQAGQFWFIYYLARWVGHKNSRTLNVFDAASQELENKKVIFSEKMAGFIQSNEIFDELFEIGIHFSRSLNLDNVSKEARRFLCSLFAAIGGTHYDKMLKNIMHSGAEAHFPFFLIRYRYSQEEFIQEEFLGFLFEQKNPNSIRSEDESYTLDLIQEACEEGMLAKQMVLERVSEYIVKHRKALFKSDVVERFISYFFIETQEGGANEAQIAFFTRSCERAVQENADSYMELYTFLKLRWYFRNDVDAMLEKHTENINALTIRCSKILNVFKRDIREKEVPEDEQNIYNDYIFLVSDFLWERTGNVWKALKPLLLAFRASEKVLLTNSLYADFLNQQYHSQLYEMITASFDINEKEKLKELRYDMANDFADYLKPLKLGKEPRQAEDYTQIERDERGFDTSYIEPSPFWRYAYIRALGDLRVKTDKRGHFFNEVLKSVSKKDPSEKVRAAARKVTKELRAIRRGYSRSNHKKCLFEAFWWLRQAHMLSLGAEVDSKNANDLRTKEWK